ncbi:MAG: sialate O-acetylesterase [Anaerocolumna sp.]|nr:sialate O-acetylesterase [Anaerocolumna sp.]
MEQIRELVLPRLISDGMVLNRNGRANIWGHAIPDDIIFIHFLGEVKETKACKDGKWKVSYLNLPPGGPHTMKITSSNSGDIELKDILIGDVFLSSGQSNMELPMGRVKDLYPEEMINCRNNNLRIFKIKEKYYFHRPLQELESGSWKIADPANIAEFSAISYFFEKQLYESTLKRSLKRTQSSLRNGIRHWIKQIKA